MQSMAGMCMPVFVCTYCACVCLCVCTTHPSSVPWASVVFVASVSPSVPQQVCGQGLYNTCEQLPSQVRFPLSKNIRMLDRWRMVVDAKETVGYLCAAQPFP